MLEVGSSKISTRAEAALALAISTSCWSEMERGVDPAVDIYVVAEF
jgi:hypothetical protein